VIALLTILVIELAAALAVLLSIRDALYTLILQGSKRRQWEKQEHEV
jgi:hypothetical protein